MNKAMVNKNLETDGFIIPEFEVFLRSSVGYSRSCADDWRTAIGLQQVEGLSVSKYLIKTAVSNIVGKIDLKEAKRLIISYYKSKSYLSYAEECEKYTDKVVLNIVNLLHESSFTFSDVGLERINAQMFDGIFKHGGAIRERDDSSREWVLDGHSLLHLHWRDVEYTLQQAMEEERQFNYFRLSKSEIIEHIAEFIAKLWFIHPFGKGNTCTVALYAIKYLRYLGYTDMNYVLFERHSCYFHNALVRANYRNLQNQILPDTTFLVTFFRNLVYHEDNKLENKQMHITLSRAVPHIIPPANTLGSEDIVAENGNINRLVYTIGHQQLSIKEMMEKIGLRDRKNFMEYSLYPSIQNGYVRMLYAEQLHHPRQKYLLTSKGLAKYDDHLAEEKK